MLSERGAANGVSKPREMAKREEEELQKLNYQGKLAELVDC